MTGDSAPRSSPRLVDRQMLCYRSLQAGVVAVADNCSSHAIVPSSSATVLCELHQDYLTWIVCYHCVPVAAWTATVAGLWHETEILTD